MPQPLQPFLHDLVVALAAPTQAWSRADGEIVPHVASSVQGVIHADVRVLSGVALRVDGEPGEHIATEVAPSEVTFTTVLRQVGGTLPDPQVRLDRVRRAAPGRLSEELTFSSVLTEPASAMVVLRLTLDGLPISRIKMGHESDRSQLGPLARTDGGASWTAGELSVALVAPGAEIVASEDGSEVTLSWTVEIPALGATSLTWSLDIADTGSVVVAAPGTTAGPATAPTTDRRLAPWLARSLADLDSLRMSTVEHPEDVFFAAGAPWYLTLFGRDSLWAARLVLPFDLEPARGTLRTLARLQGAAVTPDTAEQPGKIMHELRRSGFELGGMTLPPLYYGTIDATPLWICLLHDAWRAGLEEATVVELLPNLERALTWLTDFGDGDGDGFLDYIDEGGHGLANQGWKDSADSVRFADGTWAEGTIALCEVQGYAYEAAVSGAALLEAFGRPGAERLRGWADDLAVRFRAAFWCGEGADRFPALALDGAKQRVDSLSSNIGHLVGTGILDPEEERLVAALVSGPALDSGLGLRTMAATDRGYSPLSYHCGSVWPHDTAIVVHGLDRAGLGEHAAGLVEGLLRASVAFDGRLPELWSGEGRPVPYPASCRPQAWSAAAAVVVDQHLRQG
ncbi:MAG: hypothetical protein JWP61_1529 [Friedmanniella sp.]|nr:hypothetical protein [Friedmanniella sp.]